MKRWGTHLLIAGYLSAIGWGIFAHAIGFKENAHLGMYFIVWDMFCGWESFEMRRHLVAEGMSGQYYDAAPPWGEFIPYGADRRHHYDVNAAYAGRFAAHTLAHTEHEPITRVFLVEEAWSKKYNMPDAVWKRRFDEPRHPRSYYYLRGVYEPDGECTGRNISWAALLAHRSIINNPRLREDVARGQSYVNTQSFSARGFNSVEPVNYSVPAADP
ncbi:hypothetical protein [Planctomicrobium sp. SH664]|uniref:hypothetical protein n=1 Tax=Planctomicrobium sp. SH664 TaxID=3448125 RepID=UPI003F5AE2B3